MPAHPDAPLLDVDQLGRVFNRSPLTLAAKAQRDEIPTADRRGRARLFDVRDVAVALADEVLRDQRQERVG